jgi:hypothetical protein
MHAFFMWLALKLFLLVTSIEEITSSRTGRRHKLKQIADYTICADVDLYTLPFETRLLYLLVF